MVTNGLIKHIEYKMNIQKKCFEDFSTIKKVIKKGIPKNRDTDKKEKRSCVLEKNSHNKVESKLQQVITILEIFSN